MDKVFEHLHKSTFFKGSISDMALSVAASGANKHELEKQYIEVKMDGNTQIITHHFEYKAKL